MNHFLSSSFWVFVGKDIVAKNSYNGQIGYFNVNLGEGAYRIGSNFEHKDDVFAINIDKLKDDDSFKP